MAEKWRKTPWILLFWVLPLLFLTIFFVAASAYVQLVFPLPEE
jgi:hypothetical protein